jgi:tetratricopeptide (TPR) repeat protein
MHVEVPVASTVAPARAPKGPEAFAPTVYPLEQKQKAIEEFEKDDRSLGVLLQNALVLMKNGEYDLASHLLVDVLRRDASHEMAIRCLGECHFQRKDWARAERILKIAIAQSPLTSSLLMYADALYNLGRHEGALTIYQDLLLDLSEREEELFRVYKAIGNIQVRQGDLEAAEENYNRAYSLNPSSDVLLVNYGTLEIQRGRMQAALERYREAILLNDKNEKAWVGLAMIHREYGDAELGWGNLHKALDLDPANNTAVQLMAEWAVKDHRLTEVIERLEAFLAINDQDASKSLLLAKLFYIAGRGDLARIEVTRALSLQPDLEGGEEFIAVLAEAEAGRLKC